MNQLEAILNEWFGVKAPHLPEEAKKFIVTVSPWLAIIGVVFGAFAAFSLFSAASSFMALSGAYGAYAAAVVGAGFTPMFWLSMAFMVAMVVLEAMAIPGLRSRTYAGWKWMYYASLLSLVQGLVSMHFVSAIIGAVIGWYILFQVRSHYSGAPALPSHPHQPSQPHQ